MLSLIVHPFIRFSILLLILGGIMFVMLDTAGVKTRISHIVFESYIKAKPRQSSGQVVFVDIDDASLTREGQWPWPRTKIAALITGIQLAGAKAIIFDGVLAEPDRTSPENIAALLDDNHPLKGELQNAPHNDELLAQAIKNANNFVAGFSYGSNASPPQIKRKILIKKDIKNYFLVQQGQGSLHFTGSAQFLPVLQDVVAGNGSFMASAERDAVIRRTGLIFHDGQQIYPSLIFEGIRVFENQGREFIKIAANENYNNFQISEPFIASIGQYQIPMGADGKMWVYFREFQKDEQIPAYQFLQSDLPDLSDKIVFIASSAEGLMDLRATPLGMRPGVHVHMNALEQILQGQYLIRPHTANLLEIGSAAAISILIIALSFFVSPLWLLAIVAGVSAGAFWLSWFLFANYGGLFDPVTPTFMMSVIFVAASILSYLKTEHEKKHVRSAFGMYVSRDVMRDLEKNPDKLKLGGENKNLTVMFTDIRKFTTISEGLTPEELINLMNDFLTAMTDIVMAHGGTIDKYMGDAMMAFWNAPKDVAQHERETCCAALKMQAALAPINERVVEQAKKIGKEPVILKAGIGINTGECAVGNMGSKQRFAYSALGDAVNLASRLEGQTKNYGVATLVGEDTYIHVADMAMLEMDLILVKGKIKPVRIYALLGDKQIAETDAFQNIKKEHEAMIAAYQNGDFTIALKALHQCRKIDEFELTHTYNMYESRIKGLIKKPPTSWDGIFEATSK